MRFKFMTGSQAALATAVVAAFGIAGLSATAQAMPLGAVGQVEAVATVANAGSSAAIVNVQQRRKRTRRSRRSHPGETDPRFINDFNNPNVTFYGNGRYRDCPRVDSPNFKQLPCWAQFAFDDRGDRRRR
ncbi:MAG: hypothetical protein AAFO79_08730 [Pseudomonadota bacterium]